MTTIVRGTIEKLPIDVFELVWNICVCVSILNDFMCVSTWWLLKTDPGDIGFDPLNLRPADPAEFEVMATKELQHGRLAMLAVAGFVAQELVNQKPIMLSTFGI